MPVTIGVDPHKTSHTAAALDEQGQLLDQQRVPATLEGYQLLRQWAGRWPGRCWAVEGAHGVGRALAQRLVADGERVVDVPAKLATRVRVLSSGHGRKSDPDDAVAVAAAARSAPWLRQVGAEDQAVVLHLLTNRREDLVAMRTQTINRLHRLLVDLIPGGAGRNLTANRAAALLRRASVTGVPAVTRHQLAAELVTDVRDLDQRIAAVEKRIKAAVAQSRTCLVELFGVARCWQPGSWVRSAMCAGSRRSTISPPTPAPRPWRRPAARWSAIGCHGPGIAGSTMPCTWWRWCRSAIPPPGRPITGASAPRASRPRKRCAA
jgi:transposase